MAIGYQAFKFITLQLRGDPAAIINMGITK